MGKSANKELKITVLSQKDEVSHQTEKVEMISLDKIVDFRNHPFKVKDDDDMKKMVESVREYGVLNPILVRPKVDGNYEIISGHRRKRASEIVRKTNIPAIVRNLTDDEATIIMVDSNLQREEILPSEKAFAYKMKLEAIKHQGKKTKREENISVPMAQKLGMTSREYIGETVGESQDQVRRYIRLTELVPDILRMVDEKKMAFRPAVEISYLSKEEQRDLYDIMQYSDATPSLAQAIRLKKLSQEKNLDVDKMDEIMSEEKPNQVVKLKINQSKLERFTSPKFKNRFRRRRIYYCLY